MFVYGIVVALRQEARARWQEQKEYKAAIVLQRALKRFVAQCARATEIALGFLDDTRSHQAATVIQRLIRQFLFRCFALRVMARVPIKRRQERLRRWKLSYVCSVICIFRVFLDILCLCCPFPQIVSAFHP